MKDDRYEIRFGGSGGQGIILAAVILAEAAGVYEGYHVCQTQSYGPEARGGRSKAEVVISRSEIDYPKVIQMDLFLAMTQAALDAYFFDFKPNGLLVVDSTFVKQIPSSRVITIPFTRIARDEIGKEIVANIVALGAVALLSRKFSSENLEKAVLSKVPAQFKDINLQALHAGMKAASEVDLSHLPRSIISDEEKEV
ncbi:MAG: 2-oxoacid:acceptor oxidoreductase family protein [Desulfobulbaceae bacterium]|uniref:2-oxoacid:acceptor oxidoreductase family protein n=1 Tax=Candidatus Desulfobia pelagia TaxID=2841692 RepID=A0A8J6TEQ1_9BACT|nr:2-oxoacid:acceptor oxidoreductase family protein [Candidatus Desulfobia pelagia]